MYLCVQARVYVFYARSQRTGQQKLALMQLLKNQKVVRTLAELMPSKREQVTPGMLRQIQFVTGFTSAEVFRKYEQKYHHHSW